MKPLNAYARGRKVNFPPFLFGKVSLRILVRLFLTEGTANNLLGVLYSAGTFFSQPNGRGSYRLLLRPTIYVLAGPRNAVK